MALNNVRQRLQFLVPANNDEWLREMRGNLAMVTTMVASVTFQIGLNPPGGVVQNSDHGFIGCPTPRGSNQACPGQSVFAMRDSSNYQVYIWINSVCFYTSVITSAWLVSGAPINPGVPLLLLSTLISVSLSLLAISYSFGSFIVTPSDYHISLYVFHVFLSCFAVLAILFVIARFLAFIISDPDVGNHAHQN